MLKNVRPERLLVLAVTSPTTDYKIKSKSHWSTRPPLAPFIHLLSTFFKAAPNLALREPLQPATFWPVFSRSKIALNQL
jgi:hypothetical protein